MYTFPHRNSETLNNFPVSRMQWKQVAELSQRLAPGICLLLLLHKLSCLLLAVTDIGPRSLVHQALSVVGNNVVARGGVTFALTTKIGHTMSYFHGELVLISRCNMSILKV